MHIDQDLAEVLTEQYNGYAGLTDEFEYLDADWVLEKLQEIFQPEDLDLLIDDDFSRGLIMGHLRMLKVMESVGDDSDEG